MTEPRDDLSDALHRLRGEVRERVPMPPAAALRALATHRLRVRRTATALVAAVAVAALVLGGTSLLNATAAPPEPPLDTPAPPVVPPSVRPTPVAPEPPDDPIADVDWQHATIDIPERDGCPSGPVSFVAVSDVVDNAIGPADSYPVVLLDASDVAYGDLTGDGRPEAVVLANCDSSPEGIGTGDQGGPLLVVTRRDDGTLVGLAWAGPTDTLLHSYWIADGRVFMDAESVGVDATDSATPRLPGLAFAYDLEQGGTDWASPIEYPSIVPLHPPRDQPAVRPRAAVASSLGCPDQDLRFIVRPDGTGWTANAGGATYTVPSWSPQPQPYLFDLDLTGERLLVTALSCTRSDGSTGTGLAVFERIGYAWQGISVFVRPGHEPGAWWAHSPDSLDQLAVEWLDASGEPQPQIHYRWTGTVLEPIDE